MSTVAVPAPKHSPLFLASFALFILASILMVAGVIYTMGATSTVGDWISYWATGRLLVHHANPYDSAAVVALERANGLNSRIHVLIARNPPSALWTMVPLGYLGFYAGGLLWRLLQAVMLGASIHLLWVQYGRKPDRWHWLAWLFVGSLACIASGQSSIFTLLGIVLFLHFHHYRPFAAGAALSLCFFKPHLFLPFALVLLLWMIERRVYRLLFGFCTAIALQLLFAWWIYHPVFDSYKHAMLTDGIANQFMPAIAVELRFLIDRHAMWLSFLPTLLGCIWAVWHYARKRAAWSWEQELPLLLLVSLLAAPYAWIVDSVLVVPAIVAEAPRSSDLSRAILLLLMSAAIFQYCLRAGMDSPWLLWQVPAFLGWYVYARSVESVPAENLAAYT